MCIAAERYTGHASLVRFTFLAHVHHVQQQQSHFLVVIEWLKKLSHICIVVLCASL